MSGLLAQTRTVTGNFLSFDSANLSCYRRIEGCNYLVSLECDLIASKSLAKIMALPVDKQVRGSGKVFRNL